MNADVFEECIAPLCPGGLRGESLETIQVNLGRRCNLACRHCHLACSADRLEEMTPDVMEGVEALARKHPGVLFDLTGGAPELHPRFEAFVRRLRALGNPVQTRTNLAVLLQPGCVGLMEFLAAAGVALVGSMPCYLPENVAAQRGEGVYEAVIEALRRLNALGYGHRESLPLHLVYNPGDTSLPGAQEALAAAYRTELRERFGIEFTGLYTLANMPIGRFRETLDRTGETERYFQFLESAFNPETVEHLMCRRQVCVDWDGTLYDCDFNLALGLSVNHGAPNRLEAFDPDALRHRRIVTGRHCFGCTAGAGSSCGGALSNTDE